MTLVRRITICAGSYVTLVLFQLFDEASDRSDVLRTTPATAQAQVNGRRRHVSQRDHRGSTRETADLERIPTQRSDWVT